MEPFDPAELPAIRGEIRTDDAALAQASQDWGHIVQARPRTVVRPTLAADVAAILEFAAARDIPVAPRGAGHSPFGQGQTDGGIVLDMTGMAAVHRVTGEDVTVEAGARWRDVLAATVRRHLTDLGYVTRCQRVGVTSCQ
ncbi:MAG: FAD-binding protein [Pseudonocardiaceae bacterium]|nr:FAD-binding protein [Pseudonocardiaceae bacterium]